MSQAFPFPWQGNWETLTIPGSSFEPAVGIANGDPGPALMWNYTSAAPYNTMRGIECRAPVGVGFGSYADYCFSAPESMATPVLGVVGGQVYVSMLWTTDTDSSATNVNPYLEMWSTTPGADLRLQPFGTTPISFRSAPGVLPFIEVSPVPVPISVNGMLAGTPLFVRVGRRRVDPGGNDTFGGSLIILAASLVWQVR